MVDQPIQTTEYWDEAVDGYVAAAEPFTALFCADAVALARIEPGMALLDIAAGPGAVSLAAARQGARVTAIDFSPAMIARLEERRGDLPITAQVMDGQALRLPFDRFDRAVSVFGIPLFADWRAGLSEMVRVLQPGGLAVVCVAANPFGHGPNQLLAEARGLLWPGCGAAGTLPGMAVLCKGERLTAALQDAGLDAPVLHRREHNLRLPAEMLRGDSPMLRLNPVIADLEEADRTRVVDQATRFAERYRDGDAVEMPSVSLLAVAEKPGVP